MRSHVTAAVVLCFVGISIAMPGRIDQASSAPEPPTLRAKPTLSLPLAEAALNAATNYAKTKAGTGAIAVVDDGGALIALRRLDGTFPAASEVAAGKARTSAIFRKPTRAFEESINKGRTAMASMHGYVFLQGGVPIIVDGQVIGAVGVSGAASAEEDEQVATAGAESVSKSH